MIFYLRLVDNNVVHYCFRWDMLCTAVKLTISSSLLWNLVKCDWSGFIVIPVFFTIGVLPFRHTSGAPLPRLFFPRLSIFQSFVVGVLPFRHTSGAPLPKTTLLFAKLFAKFFSTWTSRTSLWPPTTPSPPSSRVPSNCRTSTGTDPLYGSATSSPNSSSVASTTTRRSSPTSCRPFHRR